MQAGVLNVSPNISRCSHSSWVVLIALYSSRCGGKKKNKQKHVVQRLLGDEPPEGSG